MKAVIITIFLCFASVLAFGQKPIKTVYKIRAKDSTLIVTYQGKAHKLAITEKIDAAKITDTDILFADRKDGFTYLIVNVSGWSKAKQDDRQCGAGVESNLLWIKLNPAWKITEIKSAHYQLCWSSIDADDGYKINGNLLNVEFNNFRDNVRVKLTYNAELSELGFQILETKLKEN
ncbi:MAG: hypothetical protein ABJA66_12120 [Actinomycetota bacterium]